jgi:hypothetical protein
MAATHSNEYQIMLKRPEWISNTKEHGSEWHLLQEMTSQHYVRLCRVYNVQLNREYVIKFHPAEKYMPPEYLKRSRTERFILDKIRQMPYDDQAYLAFDASPLLNEWDSETDQVFIYTVRFCLRCFT